MGVDRYWEYQDELNQCPARLAAAEAKLVEVESQLARAKNAIAILYVGNKARRPDGSVDVDAIINSILGET